MSEHSESQISVVVSVYNASKTVSSLTQRMLNSSMNSDFPLLEILLINDNSNLETRESLDELLLMDNRIRVVHLPENIGQQKATLQGMLLARGSIICTIDDDLEYLPEELPDLFQQLNTSTAEIIYGVREYSKFLWWRKWPHRLFYLLAGWKGYPRVSSMRCLRASLLNKINVNNIMQQPYPMIDQELIDQSMQTNTIPVSFYPGRSTRQSLFKLALHFIFFLLSHNRAETV